MAGDSFSPALVHRKALHLMNHGALPDAALEAEAVFQKTLAKHPINDQTFPERPLTEQEVLHTQFSSTIRAYTRPVEQEMHVWG